MICIVKKIEGDPNLMTDKEQKLVEQILEKIDSLSLRVDELSKDAKSLYSIINELKEMTNKRFVDLNEKLDTIIEINNKTYLKG